MSNIFKNKTSVEDAIDEDYLGNGGLFESDIYEGTIKTAYLNTASSSKAVALNLIIDVDGKELRSQIWMTNRDGDVTYTDKRNETKKNLPGFNQVNSLCILIAGKEVGDMDVEELTVKVYDYEAKKELPQAVDCFSELHGERVNIAVQKQTIDKTKKNDKSGVYEATGETQDINQIIKFFAADKLVTLSEVAEFIKSLGGNYSDEIENGNIPKAVKKMEEDSTNYAVKWLEQNKGKTYVKAKKASKSTGKEFEGTSNSSEKKTSSLFD